MNENTNTIEAPSVSEIKNRITPVLEVKNDLPKEIVSVVSSLSEKIKELENEINNLAQEKDRLEGLLEESGYLNTIDGDEYPGFYDEWFRESDDDPRW